MSALFPRAEYAEDQRFAHTILATHVVHRAFQSGAFVGVLVGAVRSVPLAFRSYSTLAHADGGDVVRQFPQNEAASKHHHTAGALAANRTPHSGRVLMIQRSAGVGAIVGASAIALMLPVYMYGKEGIEWQDRSWRLLHNEGQVEVDSWSLAGAVAGVGLSSWNETAKAAMRPSWAHIAGGAGIGSLGAVMAYLAWKGFQRQRPLFR